MVLNEMNNGTYTAIVTPRDDNLNIDYDKLRELVDKQVDGGVAGLVVMGTTGESSYIDSPGSIGRSSYRRMIETVRNQADRSGRHVPIIAGICAPYVSEVVEKTRVARDCGADAGLLTAVPYVKQRQNGIQNYFLSVADNGSLPIVVYDVESRVGTSIEPKTLESLAKHDKIIAIKAATGDMIRIKDYVQVAYGSNFTRDNKFKVFSGDDATTHLAIQEGASGGVSVISNVAPRMWSQLVNYCLEKDPEAGDLLGKMIPMCELSMKYGNPMTIKEMMKINGFDVGFCIGELGYLEPSEVGYVMDKLSGVELE